MVEFLCIMLRADIVLLNFPLYLFFIHTHMNTIITAFIHFYNYPLSFIYKNKSMASWKLV